MQYRPSPEELDDYPAATPVTAASVEPMPRPDYKARRHARPVKRPCAVRDRGRRVWWESDGEAV
jgi:hypothetical protein